MRGGERGDVPTRSCSNFRYFAAVIVTGSSISVLPLFTVKLCTCSTNTFKGHKLWTADFSTKLITFYVEYNYSSCIQWFHDF